MIQPLIRGLYEILHTVVKWPIEWAKIGRIMYYLVYGRRWNQRAPLAAAGVLIVAH